MDEPMDDRFKPPEAGAAPPLELGRAPALKGAAAEENSQQGSGAGLAPQVNDLRVRKPVVYKRPPGGASNLVLFVLAGVGGLALIGLLAKALKGGFDGRATEHATASTTPARPVAWQALEKGDAVLITIEVTPRNARLLLDGEPVPSNPLRLPRGTGARKLVALAEGYEPAAELVVPDGPKTVKLKLGKSKTNAH